MYVWKRLQEKPNHELADKVYAHIYTYVAAGQTSGQNKQKD